MSGGGDLDDRKLDRKINGVVMGSVKKGEGGEWFKREVRCHNLGTKG